MAKEEKVSTVDGITPNSKGDNHADSVIGKFFKWVKIVWLSVLGKVWLPSLDVKGSGEMSTGEGEQKATLTF